MPAPKSLAIELSDSDVLPIDPEWSPADSIPMLELSAIMEVEAEAAQPVPVVESLLNSAVETRVAEPVPCLLPPPADPGPNVAAVAALSTSGPSPSESLVTWQPRRRSFGWIMGSAAAASIAVILLGWGLAPTSASAESATATDAPAPIVLRAEVPEPEPAPVVASVKTPDDRNAARKWATIGNRQLKEGNKATAQKMFERALAAQPNNRMAHSGLGQIALHRKQPRKALEHLRVAVEIEPRKADNRRLLAQAYMALGRKAKARTHLEKAISYGDGPAQQLLMDL